MALGFSATVLRAYRLDGRPVLLFEDGYQGDIAQDEWVELALASGKRVSMQVESVAWGSAFNAADPPLSLVLRPTDVELPPKGSQVRGIAAPR
ncbi:MAG: hypothetical protein K8H88_02580 [Sandaracinaceae bacterium]|nr:hypothetical protein [Sandaracinaceae bacterium]